MPGIASADDLAAANINPATGLATDYLNHFNEAIMLLEMIPSLPDCAEDFLAWQPLSYAEHFRASNFKARDLAIAAYEACDGPVRQHFDDVTHAMTSILQAVHNAMLQARQDETKIRLANETVGWLMPLVAQASGIINGTVAAANVDAEQADIDHILEQ